MKKQILIADKRKELSTKYKKIIESLDNSVIIADKANDVFKYINEIEPDLILISESITDNLGDFCKKIRVLTFNTRPVIIAISKSAELDDKLNVLESGADDFLSEPIQSQEFKMRIHAHLRREQENIIDDKTGLVNKNYTLKELKRAISKNEKKAFMLLTLENLQEYNSLYSHLASDKLLQTFSAIIQSSLTENDFVGLISENEFLAITSPLYIEKIASFLTFAFDSVIPKFYSEQDYKRGYMILQGDDAEGRRCEFVHTTIGIITNEFKSYSNPEEILNSLYLTHRLAKKPAGSSYLIERPRLTCDELIAESEFNNKVLVLESDDALSFLLVTSIELQGYRASTDFCESPAVIILDAGEDGNSLIKCRQLKEKYPTSKIIMTSVVHDKERILSQGADLYLPKPYNIVSLMQWVNVFAKEFNN